jgi:hypothetical protein
MQTLDGGAVIDESQWAAGVVHGRDQRHLGSPRRDGLSPYRADGISSRAAR